MTKMRILVSFIQQARRLGIAPSETRAGPDERDQISAVPGGSTGAELDHKYP